MRRSACRALEDFLSDFTFRLTDSVTEGIAITIVTAASFSF
jgi:hypothetical protein